MASKICFRAWLTASFIFKAHAYPYGPPSGAVPGELPANCPATYNSANASGTYLLGTSFVNGNEWQIGGGVTNGEELSWTVSVAQNATTGEFSTYSWLGTPAGIDFRRGDLDYSGCGLFMGSLSQNLIRRAQSDSGDCSQMLDENCVTALENQLQTLALGYVATWTDNSPAPSNLTAGSLPRVCEDIRTDMLALNAVPDACAQFVGPKKTWYDGVYSNVSFNVLPLTGPNSTTDRTCTFNTSNDVPSFSQPGSNLSLITQYSSLDSAYQNTVYDDAVTSVYPIFTVLFPPANDSNRGGGVVSSAEAFLTCARPVNITAGSRVAAALPSPTPLRKISKPLSGGAIAGIVIGVLVFVLLVAGSLAWFLISRRRKQKAEMAAAAAQEQERKRTEKAEFEKEKKAPLLASTERHEADGGGVNGRAEMPTGMRSEMDGGHPFAELEGNNVEELEGRNLDSRGNH